MFVIKLETGLTKPQILLFFGWNANRKNVSKELTVCKM